MSENVSTIVNSIKDRMVMPQQASRVGTLVPNQESEISSNQGYGSGFVMKEPLKTSMSAVAFTAKGDFTGTNRRLPDDYPRTKEYIKPSTPKEVREVRNEVPNTTSVFKQDHTTKPPQARRPEPPRLPDVTYLIKAISKVSNLIKEYLHVIDAFDTIKDGIRDKKMYAETFYTRTQNCVYHTLREYLGVTKDENNNDVLPEVSFDSEIFSTLVFFDRIFNNRAVSFEKIPQKVMPKYRRVFSDHDGIQDLWTTLLENRMIEKLSAVDGDSIRQVVGLIRDVWCQRFTSVVIPPDKSEEEQIQTSMSTSTMSFQIPSDNPPHDDLKTSEEDGEGEDSETEGLFEGHDDEDYQLTVLVDNDGSFDIVTIKTSVLIRRSTKEGDDDSFEEVSIPFFTDLDKIPLDKKTPSLVDDRNGMWDWLIHFQPELIFTTKDPDKYLEGNFEESVPTIKCVIMDENDGIYVIGVYYIDEDIGSASHDDSLVNRVNYLVQENIAASDLSHLSRSLNMVTLFRDEEFVLKHIASYNDEYDDEIMKAAEDAITNGDITYPEHVSEDTVEESGDSDEEGFQTTDDISMDTSVVSIGRSYDEDDFSFTPMRKGSRRKEYDNG